MKVIQFAFVCCILVTKIQCNRPCIPVDFGQGIVCRCNDTYCDTVEENVRLEVGKIAQYTTSKSGQRLQKTIQHFNNEKSEQPNQVNELVLTVDESQVFQSMIGFGGAITDSAAMNILSLKPGAQELLLNSFYTTEGIEFTVGRIPIASCDYSPRVYSYDDVKDDFDLEHFSLQTEDLLYKIPVILRAMGMSKRKINLFGSPWSPPGWMKNTGNMVGPAIIKEDSEDRYHKSWAKYYVRFLEEYKSNGAPIWGLTIQNEPGSGFVMDWGDQTRGMTSQMEHDFIVKHLGPALRESGNSDVKLMIFDDDRWHISEWADISLAGNASQYVSGIAFHWYADDQIGPDILTKLHNKHPDKFILSTEACFGSPNIGLWNQTSKIVKDILGDVNNWTSGWVFWNSVLDENGGPAWTGSSQNAPIYVNATTGNFYKDPLFYGLGHFSKFLPEGSKRIKLNASGNYNSSNLQFSAFTVPENNSTVVIVSNDGDMPVSTSIKYGTLGTFTAMLPENSLTTFAWWST